MKYIRYLILVLAFSVLVNFSKIKETYALPNDRSTEQVVDLLTEGAVNSEVPKGLEKAPGIEKKLEGIKYNTIQLTDNSANDLYARVNNSGEVVWSDTQEIYYYDGTNTIQLTNNSGNFFPQINNNGDVAWMHHDGNDNEIYLYEQDTNNIIQLTDNNYEDTFDWSNSYPIKNFNNNKQIVWRGGASSNEMEIYFYNGSYIRQLTVNTFRDHLPRLNEQGQAVWIGGNQVYQSTYGGFVMRLTNSGNSKDEPNINDDGDVVWMEWVDGAMNSEIFTFSMSKNKISRITDNTNTDTNPKINNLGSIIWESWINEDPNDREVFYFDGSNIVQLTDTSGSEQKSYMNNTGNAVWENPQTPPENDFELFVYDFNDQSTLQLTNNEFNDAFPFISDSNHIVWQGYDGNDFEIFLAIPLEK